MLIKIENVWANITFVYVCWYKSWSKLLFICLKQSFELQNMAILPVKSIVLAPESRLVVLLVFVFMFIELRNLQYVSNIA